MIRRVLVVAALALLAIAGGAGVSSASPNRLPEASLPRADEGDVALDLAAYGPSILTPGTELAVSATVANPTSLEMRQLTVTMSVTKTRITTSAGLQRFLDEPGSTTTIVAAASPVSGADTIVSGTGNALPPGATTTIDVAATPSQLQFKSGTAGVYGIVIAVNGPTGILATRTAAVTWYDSAIKPLRVAFLASASGSAERVAQVTSAASVNGAALAIDPVTVTDATQASALTAGREVFGLPSENPDLTSLAHSDDDSLLSFALADAATNTAPALQSLPWLATIPAADAPTIALAAQRGAVAGVLDVSAGATLPTNAPVADVTTGSATLSVLVPDEQLSTILASYRPGMPDAAARLVAEAALEAQHGDGVTPVVVAPGDAWQLTALGVSQPLSDLLTAPWVVPVSVRSVISGSARDKVAASASLGTEEDLAPDLIKALARQLDDVSQLAQTAADPNAVYLPGGRNLLQPLAVGLRVDPDARTATYQAARDAANATLASLYVAEGSDVNLIAASGNVPVTLHNDLGVDSTVTVVMKSSSPNLVVQDRPVVTIPAGGDKTVHISVTAVKSANVTATVALENANGDVVAAPQLIRVRVRADWGNAVTAIFTVGLALLLVAGLVRTIRRGRRSSRMAPMTPASKQPSGDTDAGGDDD